MSMLIEDANDSTHQLSMSAVDVREDTDKNLRHDKNDIPPLPMPLAEAAIGHSWRLG